MSVLCENTIIGASGVAATGYTIDQSLRFNDDDSAYLSRTPASAGNRKTWTWSGWVKLGNFPNRTLLMTNSLTTPYTELRFQTDGGFFFYDYASSYNFRFDSAGLFRDPAAWYHLLIAIDTTQATSSNRVKIYLNGSQVTSFDTETYPAQNHDTGWNQSSVAHAISSDPRFNTQHWDGYLSEVHFIDGQALTPSDFGETDDTYGHWKAKEYEGTYGTNGFYLSFSNESTKHTLTANGNVQHSTAQAKVGGSSIYFDGAGDHLSAPDHTDFDFSGDFTIEFYFRPSTGSGVWDHLVGTTDSYMTGTADAGWAINYRPDYSIVLSFDNGSNNTHVEYRTNKADFDTSGNTWYHVAFVRSGGVIKAYIDGEYIASSITVNNPTYSVSSSNALRIGQHHSSGADYVGYMDELRISRTARYTTNFTPSTVAFTEDSDTKLLVHSDTTNGSTTFVDSSGVEAGLGNDLSGEENHWTPTNLAATDVVGDSPSNNFCTLSSILPDSLNLVSEGNLKVGGTNDNYAVSTIVPKGKYYAEACIATYSSGQIQVGICPIGASSNLGSDATSYYQDGNVYRNNSPYTTIASYNTGDIIGVTVDEPAGTVKFYRNNSLLVTVSSVLRIDEAGLFVYSSIAGNVVVWNFGQDSSFAGNKTAQNNTDDNGYGDFYYSPPTGYLALCTQNLDALSTPYQAYSSCGTEDEAKEVTYTSNSSADGPFVFLGFKAADVCINGTHYSPSHADFDFNANGIKLRSATTQNTGGTKTLEAWIDEDFKYSNAGTE